MEVVDYAFVVGLASKLIGASIGPDLVAQAVARDPQRLLGFAGVDPLHDPKLKAVDETVGRKLAGVAIAPPLQGMHPTHSRAMKLYERCVDAGLPVLVDNSATVGPAVLEFAPAYLYDAVARSFPELRMVIAAMGHPFIEQTLILLSKHEHVYADISALVLRPLALYQALHVAMQMGVVHKLVLGSGFPACEPEKAIVNLYSVNTLVQGTHLPPIPREQLRGIVERDALKCLNLTYPQGGVTPGNGRASARFAQVSVGRAG
jgi:predicted TIM-barrel fold metal-dependent hydrolase